MSDIPQGNILESVSQAVKKVVDTASRSVAQVSSGRGQGSGVVWDDKGRIVTSSHVVGRGNQVKVGFDGKILDARLIGSDRFSDVAVLQVSEKLEPIPRGSSQDISTGELVLALSNAFGRNVSATMGIVTTPKASFAGGWSWVDEVIVTDARLNPGYSGGPLLNSAGKMVGLNAAYFANRGIAIPVNGLEQIVEDIIREGSVKRAYLGVVTNQISLPEEISTELGQGEGLIVLGVERETPAKKAGVAVGDIIVKIGSKSVSSYRDLHNSLRKEIVGKTTQLFVLRGEKLTELSISPVAA